jgi:hypothetical protein
MNGLRTGSYKPLYEEERFFICLMAYYVFLVLLLAICTISEVLAGRLNGEGKLKEGGDSVRV